MSSKKKTNALLELGNRIREERKAQGMTQQQLAFECGVDLSQINRIELGKINTSIVQVLRICQVLEIKPAILFDFDLSKIELE